MPCVALVQSVDNCPAPKARSFTDDCSDLSLAIIGSALHHDDSLNDRIELGALVPAFLLPMHLEKKIKKIAASVEVLCVSCRAAIIFFSSRMEPTSS
jgi:hypothetical protein